MRKITLAIHTYQRALDLKRLLESEGIDVSLQNVNLENPEISPGIRVRINESDLPLALRIVENTDIFTGDNIDISPEHTILVPVDFSDYSMDAAITAVHLAKAHNAVINMLHAYIDQDMVSNMQLSDALTFDLAVDAESRRQIELGFHNQLERFKDRLTDMMAEGIIPSVKISTRLVEGVPEDVIREYTKTNVPYMVVMGSRPSRRKIDEMIGSVTSEVISKTRCSVLALPEGSVKYGVSDTGGNSDIPHQAFAPRNILVLNNLEQEDILAIDTLTRIFPVKGTTVTLSYIPGRRRLFARSVDQNLRNLMLYFRRFFTESEFGIHTFEDSKDGFTQLSQYLTDNNIDLIVLSNKRKNALARMVSPALASRLLNNFDIPLLVIPV